MFFLPFERQNRIPPTRQRERFIEHKVAGKAVNSNANGSLDSAQWYSQPLASGTSPRQEQVKA